MQLPQVQYPFFAKENGPALSPLIYWQEKVSLDRWAEEESLGAGREISQLPPHPYRILNPHLIGFSTVKLGRRTDIMGMIQTK